jgi:hypothetical protein
MTIPLPQAKALTESNANEEELEELRLDLLPAMITQCLPCSLKTGQGAG